MSCPAISTLLKRRALRERSSADDLDGTDKNHAPAGWRCQMADERENPVQHAIEHWTEFKETLE
jgi:hypothetical protein